MQYLKLALSLAWPQMVVALLWLGVGLVAFWYARATRRPVFLFGGIAAFLLSLSEVLSPMRLAYRYFTHRVDCPNTAACTTELQFGAAKYEWMIAGIAALVLLVGIFLEIARARRRAAANNAARAAARKAAQAALPIQPVESAVPAAVFASLPADLPASAEDEQPTLYKLSPADADDVPL